LGLAQVYGFVERSGGAISVNSQPGQGTQFDLYFPRYQTTEPTTTDTKTSTSVNYNGNETILIVDDEPALLHLTHEVLSLHGYHVITAQSGKQALEVLENEHIDLLLSDVIMPEMDGYQLATIVQEKYPAIKIQLASGFTDDRHNNKINDLLNQNILHKPYETEMLLKRVRSLLSEHPGQQADQLSSKQTDQPKEKGKAEAVEKEKEKEKEKIIKKDKQLDKDPGSLANSTQTRRTIMIMDDEDDIRALFKLNLEKLNYETILAKNGDEAIEIYQQSLENNKTIDAIIMDLSIPGGMNGSEVAKKLRILNPSAKLIVASGHNTGPEMVNHLGHGFDAAIEKNFDRRLIKLTLEKLFATH
ncbi:MAG: response regulator, partial [Gammaproteobacteria bacterium]|nr:response regulator [Gammaproteobacteria bacterium]